MKRKLSLVLLVFGTSPAGAQSLGDQINAVDAVQQSQENAARAAYAAQQAEMARVMARQEQAAREAQESARRVAESRASAAAAAARAQADAAREERTEAKADKQRDQAYEDSVRAIQLQEMKAKLLAEQSRAARENDIIDHSLKQQDAATDLIQSHADSNRNLSSGAKELMQKEGDADIKKESHWFGNR